MAGVFKEAVLTAKGIALLAKAQAGRCTIKLTKAATGDGSYSDGEALTNRTALKSKKQEFALITVTTQNQSNVSATRLAKKMERSKEANRGYFHRHIEAMLSYMGWFTCTDTYDCYQSRIKPYIHVGRLKKIISKIKRRQNHEGMDQGKMLREAAGAAACG